MMVQDEPTAVLKPLETIHQRGYGRYDVFRSWVRLMLAALQRDDERYLDVLDPYDDREDRNRGERNADLFSAAFGELQAAMAETNRDVLGDAYEAWGMQSDEFGQHFTPSPVSAGLVRMQMAAQDSDAATDDDPLTIADPACGSGRLLIHAARAVDGPVVCYGKDKDGLCARMTALNLCFFNIDGVAVHGDSLTTTAHAAWRTANTALGGTVERIDPTKVPVATATPADDADPATETEAETETETETEAEADTSGGETTQADVGRWA